MKEKRKREDTRGRKMIEEEMEDSLSEAVVNEESPGLVRGLG